MTTNTPADELADRLAEQWKNNPISNKALGCAPTLLSQSDREAILAALRHPPHSDDALRQENERLREHILEQSTHAQTRIQDGIEMGATVWRIALEDVARENRAALSEPVK